MLGNLIKELKLRNRKEQRNLVKADGKA